MNLYKKVSLLIILGVLVISGSYVANNYFTSYFSLQSADPIVYIENGVSGTVTITDPFFNKTVTINTGYYALDDGSGIIVSHDGYIITAFHVVGNSQAINNQQILKKMDANDIKSYVEEAAVTDYLSNYNPQLGEELLNNDRIVNNANLDNNVNFLTDLLAQKNLINVKSDEQVIKVKLRTSTRITTLNAQLVDAGNPSIEDIALLKINDTNLPLLKISSQKPTMGEYIHIYGYPSNETQTQSVMPSTAAGQLISTMSNSVGTFYYQTNAITSPGYSGGPVLNLKNEVIGILIYGLYNETNSNNSIGSLFLPSNYIIQICNKNNVPLNMQ